MGWKLQMIGCALFFGLLAGGAAPADPGTTADPADPATPAPPATSATAKAALGRRLFEDPKLSAKGNQACADCHSPDVGWTGPQEKLNAHGAVYEGSIAGRFGNRKAPSIAYASAPTLARDPQTGKFHGGMFWDGRATGEKLGDPLADQAQGPFLNPLEQALPDAAAVAKHVCGDAPYAAQFRQVWGADACGDADKTFADVALAIAAFEVSPDVDAFSSKFDAVRAGKAQYTAAEARGLALFAGKAKCASCHALNTYNGGPAVFTDYSYANIGTPKNPELPFYTQAKEFNPDGAAWVDRGLAAFLEKRPEYASYAADAEGMHKVPTLRNVDKRPRAGFVKAFGHNGYFKSLAEVVHFYNTRDSLPTCKAGDAGERKTCWPPPEVAKNVDKERMGNLGLTDAEEQDLVAFLTTLSDGWH